MLRSLEHPDCGNLRLPLCKQQASVEPAFGFQIYHITGRDIPYSANVLKHYCRSPNLRALVVRATNDAVAERGPWLRCVRLHDSLF